MRWALLEKLRRMLRSVQCSGASSEVSQMHERQLQDIGLTRTEDCRERIKVAPASDDLSRF